MAATPAFFSYPDGSMVTSTLETTDLGEALSSLQEESIREVSDAWAMDGGYQAQVGPASRLAVHLVLENFTSEAVYNDLLSLASLLERGTAVGFTANQEKAWAGFCRTLPERGDTTLYTTGDVFMGLGTIAAGDWLCIEGHGSYGIREYVKVGSISGSTITLDATTPLLYSYTDDEPVLVRYRDFWPCLVWPTARRRQPFVTTERRITYTLDVILETEPTLVTAYYEQTGTSGLTAWRATTTSPAKVTYSDLQTQARYRGGMVNDGYLGSDLAGRWS